MAEWLNNQYAGSLLEAAARFKRDGHLQLLQFLSKPALKELQSLTWKEDCSLLQWKYQSCAPPAFVRSPEFLAVLSTLIGHEVKSALMSGLRFRKGDYTVLYDSLAPGRGVAFFLDANAMNGDWGGYTSFIKDSEEVVRIVPEANSLSLVRNTDLRFFTKYVNHHAKNDRICIGGLLHLNN